jgi:hypothetical protein
MSVEGRGWVTGVGIDRSTGNGRNRLVLAEGGSLSFGGTSRMNRELQVRICEGPGVKVSGATRRLAKGDVVGQIRFIEQAFGIAALA